MHSSAERLARSAIKAAADEGFEIAIGPDTPLLADEYYLSVGCPLPGPFRWSDQDELFAWLTERGCSWVNLWFTLDDDGVAVAYYEAKPEVEPVAEKQRPPICCNGGGFLPQRPILHARPSGS